MASTNLKNLRLQYSGISPEFSPTIKQYYFVVGSEIESIEITAIPEDSNADVTIIGNKNLKYGLNKVSIEVQNDGEYSIYNINITRTDDMEMANANLEKLAIRQGELVPEFNPDITNYRLEVRNDIYRIEILAIPERQNAIVETMMNYELEEGSNMVQISVLAEDGFTEKVYRIDVYRRNEMEEAEHENNIQNNAERLSAILSKEENEEQYAYNYRKIYSDNSNKNETGFIVLIAILAIIVFSIAIYFIKKNKKS